MTALEAWHCVIAWRAFGSVTIWRRLRPHAVSAHIEPHWSRLDFADGHLAWSCGGCISFGGKA